MDKINKEIEKYCDGSLGKGIGLYLLERAKEDLTLASNLAKENKSLSECVEYITGEAYKKAINNCYFGWDNDVLYRMALHYYQEDEIKINKIPINTKASTCVDKPHPENTKVVVNKPKKVKKTNVPEGQMSLF